MSQSTQIFDSQRFEALIEERRFQDAVALLEPHLAQDVNGDVHGLLGLAHFQLEHYTESQRLLEQALTLSRNKVGRWQIVGEHARVNAFAEMQVVIPDITYFQTEHLLAVPPAAAGELPSPIKLSRVSIASAPRSSTVPKYSSFCKKE